MGKFKVKKEYKTGATSFTVLLIVIGLMILCAVVAVGVCFLQSCASSNKDRKPSDAIAIAKTVYGCDDALVISHASIDCEYSKFCYYVLAVKGDEEVFLAVPSSKKADAFLVEWQLNMSFRDIAKLALGDRYEEKTAEVLRDETDIIDNYDIMPRFYNGECPELDELVRNKALDVPFMIQFEHGDFYAVQVGGEIKIFTIDNKENRV